MKIIFVGRKHEGSFKSRGYQIGKYLQDTTQKSCVYVHYNELSLLQIVSDDIVVFIKCFPTDVTCKKVVDIVDDYALLEKINEYKDNVDLIIFPNKKCYNDFSTVTNKGVVVPHHWDHSLETETRIDNDLKFVYIGTYTQLPQYVYNISSVDRIMDNYSNLSEQIKNYNVHINIREENDTRMKYKPGSKLLTAACVKGVVIITTKDATILEEPLMNSYPYLMNNHHQNELERLLTYVKETYKTDIWYNALNILEQIKTKYSVKCIGDSYITSLESFGLM